MILLLRIVNSIIFLIQFINLYNKLLNEGNGVGMAIWSSLFVKVLNNTITKGLHLGIYFGDRNNSVIGFNNVHFDTLNTFSNLSNVYGISAASGFNNANIYGNNVSDFHESIVSSGMLMILVSTITYLIILDLVLNFFWISEMDRHIITQLKIVIMSNGEVQDPDFVY